MSNTKKTDRLKDKMDKLMIAALIPYNMVKHHKVTS